MNHFQDLCSMLHQTNWHVREEEDVIVEDKGEAFQEDYKEPEAVGECQQKGRTYRYRDGKGQNSR